MFEFPINSLCHGESVCIQVLMDESQLLTRCRRQPGVHHVCMPARACAACGRQQGVGPDSKVACYLQVPALVLLQFDDRKALGHESDAVKQPLLPQGAGESEVPANVRLLRSAVTSHHWQGALHVDALPLQVTTQQSLVGRHCS